MRDIPPRVSEEQLPWVEVTPYHPHNSVNLRRHLLHSMRDECVHETRSNSEVPGHACISSLLVNLSLRCWDIYLLTFCLSPLPLFLSSPLRLCQLHSFISSFCGALSCIFSLLVYLLSLQCYDIYLISPCPSPLTLFISSPFVYVLSLGCRDVYLFSPCPSLIPLHIASLCGAGTFISFPIVRLLSPCSSLLSLYISSISLGCRDVPPLRTPHQDHYIAPREQLWYKSNWSCVSVFTAGQWSRENDQLLTECIYEHHATIANHG